MTRTTSTDPSLAFCLRSETPGPTMIFLTLACPIPTRQKDPVLSAPAVHLAGLCLFAFPGPVWPSLTPPLCPGIPQTRVLLRTSGLCIRSKAERPRSKTLAFFAAVTLAALLSSSILLPVMPFSTLLLRAHSIVVLRLPPLARRYVSWLQTSEVRLNNVRRQPGYVLRKERRNMEEQRTHGSKEVGAMAEGAVLEQQRIRTERALSMLADGQILFQKDGAVGWLAFDPEGGVHHLGPHACDCEDFTRRCAPMRICCKHMEALRIAGRSFPISTLQETFKCDPRPPAVNLMELLGAPFPAEAIHWKPQKVSFQGNRALAVAYLDAREVAGRLDEVVGPLGWQVVHQVLGDQLVTGIGIRDPADRLLGLEVGQRLCRETAG